MPNPFQSKRRSRKFRGPRGSSGDGSFEDLHWRDKALIRYEAQQEFWANVLVFFTFLILGVVIYVVGIHKAWW